MADLRTGTNIDNRPNMVTLGSDNARQNGEGVDVESAVSIAGQTRSRFHLTNRIIADNPNEGIWEFMAVGVYLYRNADSTFRIGDLQPARSSVQVEGNIVGGTNDSTRVAGAKFLLNAYTLSSTGDYFQIGEAFNGFVHKADNPTYGDIFGGVELYRTTNDYLGLRITNNSSIRADGCTIYLRVLMSESL